MGLLDAFNTDEGRFGLGLLAAAAPRADGAGFGQRMMEGVNSVDAWKKQQAMQKMLDLQMAELQRKSDEEKQIRAAATASVIPATAAVAAVPQAPLNLPTDTGPNLYSKSVSNMSTPGTAAVAAKPQSFDYEKYANLVAGVSPEKALAVRQLLAKDDTPVVVPEGGTLYNRKGEFLASGSPKREPVPSAMQEYALAVQQGFKGNFFDYQQALKRAGATVVDMRDGQAGFNNEMKLLDGLKGEPIYKTHSEVADAHRQIKAALAQGTPISDTAAATKIMKLLDPGSVVRESELGMAMAAAGRMDRLKYYLTNFTDGTKLTPTQRTDFANLADELTAASAQAYNKTRKAYADRGTSWGLNADRALGPEAQVPSIMGGNSTGSSAPKTVKWENLNGR